MDVTRLEAGPQGPAVTDDRYIDDAFGEGGYFSRVNPNYRVRPGQIAFARHAHACLDTGVPTLDEAPCGIGKTLGYLLVASRFASRGKVVLVVTATNGLIQQMVHVDLPLLAKAVPWPVTWQALTGRSTYLCKNKIENFAPGLFEPKKAAAARRLLAWSQTTETGVRDDAPDDAAEVWPEVSVGPEECLKPNCPVEEFCFAERARKKAKKVGIIVTNYHMLALHLQTGRVLPEFDAILGDEAHEMPDICQGFFGHSMTKAQAKKFVGLCMDAGVDATATREHFDRLFEACGAAMAHPLDGLFDREKKSDEGRMLAIEQMPGGDHSGRLRELQRAQGSLDAYLEAQSAQHERIGYSDAETVGKARQARRMSDRFVRTLFLATEGQVRWIESGKNGSTQIHSEPVTVAPMLRSMLFESHPRTFLTSATLSTNGSFAFIRSQLGTPKDTPVHTVESPFDFEKQCILIVPPMPCPDDDPEAWAEGTQAVLRYVVQALDGRTMFLSTSTHRLRAAYADLERVEGGRRSIYVQGQGSLRGMVDAFKRDERSVIMGLNTLWTGVDAPGDTLSAVVIDRLPMLTSSPQLEAVKAAVKHEKWVDDKGVERTGRDFFSNYYFPKSALRLRQGFGRGVRSVTDVCVVVCCDNRLLERPYGSVFLGSLPKMELSRRLEDMVPFLQYARAAVRGSK